MLLEQFSLAEIKDIMILLRKRYFLFLNYRIYHLNKFDLITLLRNSQLVDESNPSSITITIKKDKITLKPCKRRYYRGMKQMSVEYHNKSVILDFS